MPSHQARSCHSRFRILAGLGTLALLGCGDVAGPDDLQQVTGDVGSIAAPPAAGSTIAFQSFMDDVGAQASKESRTLIRTARGYQAFFGHAPPAAVDFSREWVMFYAAGTTRTGGYEASFLAVLRVGRSLVAITRLESPGAGCVTTDALTTPYALIKFPAQGDASAQFFKQDSTRDCGASLCAAVTCPVGSDCDPMTGKCIGGSVQCGGIAGIACPGLGKCVDAPNDGCDPRMGADCGGICSCPQNVACDANSNFDSSPTVCACVLVKPPVCGPVCAIACQYGNVLDAKGCPTCACNPPPTVTCGGITGKTCPGAGKCVDDPNDSCDPARGGADCGGLCSCPQAVMCDPNSKFDSSPSVCACVPVKPVCGPVCEIFCQYGNVLDANGCPTCKCNPSPMDPCATVRCAAGTHCDGGKCLADGPSCGGIAGIQCPGLGKCVDDPLDSCLPSMGGADCGGICSCDQNAVACPPDRKFDGSPSVCACVPVTPPMCPPVCKIDLPVRERAGRGRLPDLHVQPAAGRFLRRGPVHDGDPVRGGQVRAQRPFVRAGVRHRLPVRERAGRGRLPDLQVQPGPDRDVPPGEVPDAGAGEPLDDLRRRHHRRPGLRAHRRWGVRLGRHPLRGRDADLALSGQQSEGLTG